MTFIKNLFYLIAFLLLIPTKIMFSMEPEEPFGKRKRAESNREIIEGNEENSNLKRLKADSEDCDFAFFSILPPEMNARMTQTLLGSIQNPRELSENAEKICVLEQEIVADFYYKKSTGMPAVLDYFSNRFSLLEASLAFAPYCQQAKNDLRHYIKEYPHLAQKKVNETYRDLLQHRSKLKELNPINLSSINQEALENNIYQTMQFFEQTSSQYSLLKKLQEYLEHNEFKQGIEFLNEQFKDVPQLPEIIVRYPDDDDNNNVFLENICSKLAAAIQEQRDAGKDDNQICQFLYQGARHMISSLGEEKIDEINRSRWFKLQFLKSLTQQLASENLEEAIRTVQERIFSRCSLEKIGTFFKTQEAARLKKEIAYCKRSLLELRKQSRAPLNLIKINDTDNSSATDNIDALLGLENLMSHHNQTNDTLVSWPDLSLFPRENQDAKLGIHDFRNAVNTIIFKQEEDAQKEAKNYLKELSRLPESKNIIIAFNQQDPSSFTDLLNKITREDLNLTSENYMSLACMHLFIAIKRLKLGIFDITPSMIESIKNIVIATTDSDAKKASKDLLSQCDQEDDGFIRYYTFVHLKTTRTCMAKSDISFEALREKAKSFLQEVSLSSDPFDASTTSIIDNIILPFCTEEDACDLEEEAGLDRSQLKELMNPFFND